MRDDAAPLLVACLCAAWCRTCDGYAPVFEQVLQGLRATHPGLQSRWIDIEDEAELLGDVDIETFPTIVVLDAQQVRFAGPLTPQPETLLRVLRAALASSEVAGEGSGPRVTPALLALAQRLGRGRA